MSETNDKPGIGVYMCVCCGRIVILHNKDDALPECPVCNGREFYT